MVYEDETKDVWVPPSLKQDEILRLKGDLDGAIASATSQLATRHSPSSSIRTLTMACLESGRELEGIAALRNTCDGNDDAVVRAMLLLRSRIADQSERSALCMLANDYTMRLIMEGADSSKIIRSIVATSQAGLALERTTLDAIRLAVDQPNWWGNPQGLEGNPSARQACRDVKHAKDIGTSLGHEVTGPTWRRTVALHCSPISEFSVQ